MAILLTVGGGCGIIVWNHRTYQINEICIIETVYINRRIGNGFSIKVYKKALYYSIIIDIINSIITMHIYDRRW